MATYDIGARSIIFKRISMFLQETYMSTLEVSDEYTLTLAKCIYEYLRDFFPNTHKYWYQVLSMPEDFFDNDSNKKYFIYDSDTKTYVSKDTINSSWKSGTYYTPGLELSVADIYALGLPTGIEANGAVSYNLSFPGIQIYTLLGYTKDFKQASDILNLADEQKIYTLNETTPFLKILENPNYNILKAKYDTETVNRESGQAQLSDREYNLLLDKMTFIEEQRACLPTVPTSNSSYEEVQSFIQQGLDWVSIYNISSWPINETILQFLAPDIVVTESSDIDDIAQMQLLATAIDYVPGDNLGLFDKKFADLCRDIQLIQSTFDSRILVTGYCDIFVERYLRSKNDVRMEVY